LPAISLILWIHSFVHISICFEGSLWVSRRAPAEKMESTTKGNKWYFGMKAHIGTDTQGLAHRVAETPANTRDATLMDVSLHGHENVFCGEKAYVSERRKAAAKAQVWNGVYCARQPESESSIVRTSLSTRRATGPGPGLSTPSG